MGHETNTGLARDDRAQTLQDFVLGIGIFILAFMFVLSLFPGLLTPFQSTAGGSERAQADQTVTRIVTNTSVGAQSNQLGDDIESIFSPSRSESDLLERFGLPSTANVNVTIESLDGSNIINGTTNTVNEREVATSTRIVTFTERVDAVENAGACTPACRLVVRIW